MTGLKDISESGPESLNSRKCSRAWYIPVRQGEGGVTELWDQTPRVSIGGVGMEE